MNNHNACKTGNLVLWFKSEEKSLLLKSPTPFEANNKLGNMVWIGISKLFWTVISLPSSLKCVKVSFKCYFQPDDNPDPTARSTLYSITLGGFLTGLAAYGTNQAVIQRALGTKSMRRAQWSYIISGPMLLLTQLIAVTVGWVIFAYFAQLGCDPIKDGKVDRADKILPYFVMEVIDYPTVPGFFFASALCGSLSTISSSINAVSAVLWDDVLIHFFGKLPELTQSIVRKVVAALFGCLIIGAAFVLESNKENTTLIGIVFSVFGTLQGPVLAMFFFAALLPFSNGIGALVGGVCALSVTLWMTVGRTQLGAFFQRLPVPQSSCTPEVMTSSGNVTQMVTSMMNATTTTEAMILPSEEDRTDLEYFYSISFWYYPLISVIIVFVVDILVTHFTWCCLPEPTPQKKYLFPVVRRYAGKEDSESGKEVDKCWN